MKLFRQFILVFGFYYIGEILNKVCSIPLPGSLIGMILLFLSLLFHIVRLEQLQETVDFLLGHLPFFFIPAGVAFMDSFTQIQHIWLQILVVCITTTFITMAFSACSIQKMMERKKP